MTRVLRYPRMFAAACAVTFACAALRDFCVSRSFHGYAQVLLYATLLLLPVCLALLSCRFVVDAEGVGVGFLLQLRRTPWKDLSACGVLYCNSRRRYLYGMYRGHTDFLNLLHRAPACGKWGFVVPMGDTLLQAVCLHCPFGIDLSPLLPKTRSKGMRAQWHQAALYALALVPVSVLALVTGALMIIRAAHIPSVMTAFGLTLCALLLAFSALAMLRRFISTVMTCPAFSEEGVSAGRSMYLPWEDVRFGYVHRIAHMSGFYLLSLPHYEMQRRNAPPVVCLSMPDTSTMLLAYLTYCPHADKGIQL